MEAIRHAEVSWSGDLFSGSGTIDYVSSGAFTRLPVSWASRTEKHEGRTSPEELLAAAHASCFSMQFSNLLAKNGTVAERLKVTARVTITKQEVGWKVTSSALEVKGTVPGMDQATFEELANSAKDGCPISSAIKGNVELSVTATLEG